MFKKVSPDYSDVLNGSNEHFWVLQAAFEASVGWGQPTGEVTAGTHVLPAAEGRRAVVKTAAPC